MAIIKDSVSIVSASRKVRFVVQIANTLDYKKVFCNVVINGNQITTVSKTLVLDTASNLYYAEIDVQSIVQDFLRPSTGSGISTSFSDTNAQYTVLNEDLFCDVQIDAQYWYLNSANGKIEDSGNSDTLTTAYFVFAATVQHLEDINLTPFQPLVPPIGISQYLTNNRGNVEICQGESYFLSFLSAQGLFAGNKALRFIGYNASNVVIYDAVIDITSLLTTSGTKMLTVGAGLANMPTVWDDGSFNPLDPLLAYYTVEQGGGTIATWANTGETKRFTVKECCNTDSVRLYWMNNKSSFEAKTFKYSAINTDTTYDRIQKPLPYGTGPFNLNQPLHNPIDRGIYPVNIFNEGSCSIDYVPKTKDESLLINELFYSPEVYMTFDNLAFQPCIIKPNNSSIYVSDDIQPVSFVITPANSTLTMRN